MSAENLTNGESAMTVKALVLELYADMKAVRPAVETLLAANLANRLLILETDRLAREAAQVERKRIGTLTNKALGAIVLCGQFVLAVWIAVATGAVKL